MNNVLSQYLPEVISFFKELAVGYILYRITNHAAGGKPPESLQQHEAQSETHKKVA